MMIAAIASVLLAQAGVGEPKPQPDSPIGVMFIESGAVKRFKVTSRPIEPHGDTLLVIDGGNTVYNHGLAPQPIVVDGSVLELAPGELIITMAGTGNNAKSCSVTCGTVGNPPVQYYACCFITALGSATCECREPSTPDLDCAQGGVAATQCSTSQ